MQIRKPMLPFKYPNLQ